MTTRQCIPRARKSFYEGLGAQDYAQERSRGESNFRSSLYIVRYVPIRPLALRRNLFGREFSKLEGLMRGGQSP